MKTVNVFMVRKPSDIEDVISTTKANAGKEREVFISEVIMVDKSTYNRLCSDPLGDFDFLDGKGGADAEGNLLAVEVVCTEFRGIMKSLIINPEGTNYCRYMGRA